MSLTVLSKSRRVPGVAEAILARGRFLVAKRMSQTLQKIAKNETARSTDSLNDKTGVHLESRRFDVIDKTWAAGSEN